MNTKSSQEHYGLDVPDEDRYTLGRNYVASARYRFSHISKSLPPNNSAKQD